MLGGASKLSTSTLTRNRNPTITTQTEFQEYVTKVYYDMILFSKLHERDPLWVPEGPISELSWVCFDDNLPYS